MFLWELIETLDDSNLKRVIEALIAIRDLRGVRDDNGLNSGRDFSCVLWEEEKNQKNSERAARLPQDSSSSDCASNGGVGGSRCK